MTDDTFQDDIATFKSRIAQAETQRDGWRAAGHHEKYLEACSMVDALELQLEQRLRRATPASQG
jgi:hypothetical protein